MKTWIFICSISLAACLATFAATPKTGFIREAGVYLMDTNGSQVEVSRTVGSQLALSVIRISDHGRDTINVPKFSNHKDWFIYMESPSRIWTFDGHRQLDAITPQGRYAVTMPGVFKTCPQTVWEAVPESVRRFLHDQQVP